MTEQQKKIQGKLEVSIGRAIKFIIDFEDEREIGNILSSIEKIKDQLIKFDKTFCSSDQIGDIALSQPNESLLQVEDGYEKIADMLDNVTVESLRRAKVFSIKGQEIQLLKPSQFKTATDAICVLIFILEAGLGRRDLEYSSFRDIFESQNIKSGSPLAMLMNNLKNAKYIDGRKYESKIISLAPKGQEIAIEVLNKLLR